MKKQRGQISIEYLIVVSFVTFLVITVLGLGLFYTSEIKDQIRFNQLEDFAQKVISSAEIVFYRGEPSQISIFAYLPSGIQAVEIQNTDIIFSVSTSHGLAKIAYPSNVNIEGTISPSEGTKHLKFVATIDKVLIISP